MRLLILILAVSFLASAAIQFDTAVDCVGSTGTSFTCAYTMGSGANGAIIVSTFANGNAVGEVSSIVWDVATANQSFTKLSDFAFFDPGTGFTGTIGTWLLIGPTTTGARLITYTLGGGVKVESVARSYTGVKQTGQPEANSGNLTPTCGNTNCNATVTTVADNAWLVLSLSNVTNRPIQCNQSGDNCTNPISEGTNFRISSADLGPITPPGASTITANAGGGGTSVMGLFAISLAPSAVVAGPKHKVTIE